MKVIEEGEGKLVGWYDPDENREWIAENKSRELKDKRTGVKEVVDEYIDDGDFIASGGFGHIRVSMAVIYEIIRQEIEGLTMAGKTAVHDSDILIGAGCVDKIECAYSFGHELRGLSPASRRAVESGECEVVAEISNAGYQWRFLAGSMGVPFMPTRALLGTDTLKYSSAKVVEDPFTEKPICLVPSCNPDVSMIHVPRCDKYGNAQIDGIAVEDIQLSRASRRLIITTEEVIDEEDIRDKPWRTAIPFYLVDAVVEVPWGSHPCEMPYQYFFDEDHIAEWLRRSKTEEGAQEYFDEYVYGADDFDEYLELIGGEETMKRLKEIENYERPMKAPWLRGD